MTTYDWPAQPDQEVNDTMAKATPAEDTDPLAALDMEIVPAKTPASPRALSWIEEAIKSETRRGTVKITSEAQFNLVREALRRAAEDFDDVSVTCSRPDKDKDAGTWTELNFYAGKRKGRKDDA